MENQINNLRKSIAELYLQKAQKNIDKLDINQQIKKSTTNNRSSLLEKRTQTYQELRDLVTQIAEKENELSILEEESDLKYITPKNGGKKRIMIRK